MGPKNLVIEPAIDTCSREAAMLQGACACQTTSPFIEQVNVKGVLNQSVDGNKLIMIKMWCMFMWFLREHGKRSRDKQVKRDREPSRVPVRMLIWKMRKMHKKIILKPVPVSCKTYHLKQNYSLWYENYVHRTDWFFTKYFRFRSPSTCACNNAGNDFDQDQYCVSKKKLLMCAPLTSKETVAVG